MKNLLTILVLSLTLISCGPVDWDLYSTDFLVYRHDEFVLQELPYVEMNEMKDSVNIATLFSNIHSQQQIKENQYFLYTMYEQLPITTFSIVVNPGEACGTEMYMFNTRRREVLDYKKVAFRNCPMDGSETLDFKYSMFNELQIVYHKQFRNQFIPDQYTEKCTIDSLGKFDCKKIPKLASVNLRDSLLIKREPKKRFKYIKKLPLGTKIYSTGSYSTDTDSTLSRPYEYVHVVREDGKEGWVERKYVIEGATAGTIISKAPLFKDSKTKYPFDALNPMDIIAVTKKDTVNGRFFVTAKTFGIKKQKEGWISGDHFSLNELDVEFSRLVSGSDDAQKISEALTGPKYKTVNEELKKGSGLNF